MTNKWDSHFTEENLQEQIQAAKTNWSEIKFEVLDVEYKDGYLWLYFSENKRSNFNFSITGIKCLENLTTEQLSKVEVLGTRAIRWEEQDIDFGVEEILLVVQTVQNWLDNVRK